MMWKYEVLDKIVQWMVAGGKCGSMGESRVRSEG